MRLHHAGRDGQSGQSMVEFALILAPLLLILLGIVQFGFIFNAYVTLTNAAREAAREGSIYVYERTLTKDENDEARNEAIKTALISSMNFLSTSAPQFTTTGTWSQAGSTWTDGDVKVTYSIPSGLDDSDARLGQQVTVNAAFHQDLIVPLIAAILPRDAGGRLVLGAEVTMVIN
jgi:Flp pilus assembly protein TadG